MYLSCDWLSCWINVCSPPPLVAALMILFSMSPLYLGVVPKRSTPRQFMDHSFLAPCLFVEFHDRPPSVSTNANDPNPRNAKQKSCVRRTVACCAMERRRPFFYPFASYGYTKEHYACCILNRQTTHALCYPVLQTQGQDYRCRDLPARQTGPQARGINDGTQRHR